MPPSSSAPRVRIGVVGVGRMGSGVLARLAPLGAAASDLDASRREAVEASGAAWMDSVTALAVSSDVLVTVLPGPDELDAAMRQALPALPEGALWLDLTSGDPARASALADEAAERGIDAVAAPMGGGPDDAAAGTLTFYIGGAPDAVDRALPILSRLAAGDGMRVCGPHPRDGHIVKLLANALWFANAVAAGEALLIGEAHGLAPQHLQALLAQSAGSSIALSRHVPEVFHGDYLETFGVDRVVEELDAVAALARASATPSPVLDASADLHREALARFGPAPGELLGVRMLEELARRDLR
ncbi:NAD(P)-binding domain-containing protein [Leifsonia shinshuensis]|uniref:NAD(P)-dependent oxidoreductase n=1 Tax=Leifsonia shinshuensis TaxID=150026 RepID=UPI002866B361|nr:NAD(P)-binding domain-containing protein [Leifsonia shinshuensis]MDR6972060.1 3-hydroxyisobutyrate dehydrogenase-like beta-hydroxyacid dehydrogenase [Leifsonia shinshuensis]